MLKGKKVLLCVCGSIAAYKSAMLVRLLAKAGAKVKVVMTPSATEFITPLTLSTVSKNEVLVLWKNEKENWNNHVELGLWADIILVAPISANTLAKFANGICDNLVCGIYLSAKCAVAVAPAMDLDMWKHPSTQKNIETIKSFGTQVLPVGKGELASGLNGEGRMLEPKEILEWLNQFFSFSQKKSLAGKKVLVNGGPTFEAIDPVRYIGNFSSGKMGIALANEFASRGATVNLILGPGTITEINSTVSVTRVVSAAQMYNECKKYFVHSDITVLAAAVADFTPQKISKQKIKKTSTDHFVIELKRTKDILKTFGEQKKKNQLLIGFALETEHEVKHAKQKLKEKNLDAIVLNSANDSGAGFQSDSNKISIINKNGKIFPFDLKAKSQVATDIVNFIEKNSHA